MGERRVSAMSENFSRAWSICEFCNFHVNHDSLAGGHIAQSRRLARGKVLGARDMVAIVQRALHTCQFCSGSICPWQTRREEMCCDFVFACFFFARHSLGLSFAAL